MSSFLSVLDVVIMNHARFVYLWYFSLSKYFFLSGRSNRSLEYCIWLEHMKHIVNAKEVKQSPWLARVIDQNESRLI
ncbi:hypothetical protein BDV27DRAFT_9022 [Aspergillus caelatus]|uniref:Uncharacterized protein n=2 Tax=Aspergillus subgen. Circumdati TaxID=2720871 RepID=A0A5N7AHY5_9EURO|nr:uncharacterized protein BDV27DRAFT_9022 [Aspergillus caelatus]KAE8369365.1 hypothetical protein BDV27DRAFT_9022 [Aspergillus caelatus]KAE8419084.1 hypothetical protein BDV36DRAFT_143799 [Aspergillus pseudocaelatus]